MTLKVPFGKAGDGLMVSVDFVERGLACNCVCVGCGARLIAHKGEVYVHHFRHESESDCQAGETAIHLFAKQLICGRLQLRLPDPCGVMIKATEEYPGLPDIRPDVLAEFDNGETVAIEIWVAHQVPQNKVAAYNKMRQAAVEIDLRPYHHAEKSEAEWERAILFDASRGWLSPPEYIRRQREEERQRWIDDQKRRQQAAELARQEAERHRVEIEKAWQKRNEERAKAAELARQEAMLAEAIEHERELRDAALRELERQRLIEQRAKDAEARLVRLARLHEEMQPPDLQKLVLAHGTYDRITSEAWGKFDWQMANWKARTAAGEFHHPPYDEVRHLHHLDSLGGA